MTGPTITTEPFGQPPDEWDFSGPAQPACGDEHCITCSDEGRPGVVVEAPQAPTGLALVRTATGDEQVDVMLVGDVRAGDRVLVHAGTAITRLPVVSPPGEPPTDEELS